MFVQCHNTIEIKEFEKLSKHFGVFYYRFFQIFCIYFNVIVY